MYSPFGIVVVLGKGRAHLTLGHGVVCTPSCTVHRGVINRSTTSPQSHLPAMSPTARSNTQDHCVVRSPYQLGACVLAV